jgi:hypothetical protein
MALAFSEIRRVPITFFEGRLTGDCASAGACGLQ